MSTSTLFVLCRASVYQQTCMCLKTSSGMFLFLIFHVMLWLHTAFLSRSLSLSLSHTHTHTHTHKNTHTQTHTLMHARTHTQLLKIYPVILPVRLSLKQLKQLWQQLPWADICYIALLKCASCFNIASLKCAKCFSNLPLESRR